MLYVINSMSYHDHRRVNGNMTIYIIVLHIKPEQVMSIMSGAIKCVSSPYLNSALIFAYVEAQPILRHYMEDTVNQKHSIFSYFSTFAFFFPDWKVK